MEPNNTSVASVRLTGPVELLSSAWSLFKAHWKVLVMIAVVPSVLTVVGQFLLTVIALNVVVFGIISVILMIGSMILSFAMQGALTDAIRKLSANPGEIIDTKSQYRVGFSFFWSFVFIAFIQMLIYMGATVLLIIPGIIVSGYLFMSSLALFIDGKKGFEALTESYSLIKDRWWGVLGRFLFIGVIWFAVGLVFAGLLFIVNLALGFIGSSILTTIVTLILSTLLNTILMTMMVIYMYKIYISLKATRSPNVSVMVFRKWLKAFVIIGPVVAILGIVSSIVLMTLAYNRNIPSNSVVLEQSGLIENRLDNSTK